MVPRERRVLRRRPVSAALGLPSAMAGDRRCQPADRSCSTGA